MGRTKRRILIGAASFLLVLALLLGACALYVSDYYRADTAALAAFSEELGAVPEAALSGALAYGTGEECTALIFYPGGKVEHTAYIPLMQAMAARGILCIVVEMPFRLAVLDMDAADRIRALYPSVENWYIGGHSLGGSMAAAHVEKNPDAYRGLLLLGAYSTADLSNTSLSVLSLYGSEDGVMNREKYEENRDNLPSGFAETVMEGGCHAYFGLYGEQQGDGVATLTPKEQILLTAEAVVAFLGED